MNPNIWPPGLQQLVRALAACPGVERVILFGSRARGDARDRADVDLAISAPHATRRQWLDIWSLADEAETLLSIDVVRLEEASPELFERISAEGVPLYVKSR